jgi:hypothetical protein
MSAPTPRTQLQWDALPLHQQMLFKIESMLTAIGRIEDKPPAVAWLKDELDSLKGNLRGPVTKKQARLYESLSKQFRRVHAPGPAREATVADIVEDTPRSLPAVINAKTKAKRPKRPLNKRQRAVKQAYDLVKKGEVEFEGSDEKFISLGNKNFAKLVNKLQARLS